MRVLHQAIKVIVGPLQECKLNMFAVEIKELIEFEVRIATDIILL